MSDSCGQVSSLPPGGGMLILTLPFPAVEPGSLGLGMQMSRPASCVLGRSFNQNTTAGLLWLSLCPAA